MMLFESEEEQNDKLISVTAVDELYGDMRGIDRGRTSLDDCEIEICTHVGKRRHETNLKHNIREQKIGDQDPVVANIHSVAAELSWCKRANCCPDLTDSIRRGGIDFILRGHTGDVKWTWYENGMLLVPLEKNTTDKKADVYVLMIGRTLGSYRFAGWCWGDEIMREENKVDKGYGLTYGLEQNQLR